ncbi:MAG: hypothetical protein R3F62_00505 [Planctomycetota bacterium]
MKRWRTPRAEWLVEAGAGGFQVFDLAGALLRTHAPRSDSLEDTLYRTAFEVDGDRLLELSSSETRGAEPERRSRVLQEGLVELSEAEPPTEATVRRWLADHDQRRRRASADLGREVAALAACPAALPELQAASRLLADRALRLGDRRAPEWLALRGPLSAARASFPGPSWERVLAEVAGAGRSLAFRETEEDRGIPPFPHAFGAVPQQPTGPLLSAARERLGPPPSPEVQALVDDLEALLRGVVGDADVQGYVDATRNAASLLRAATRLERAAVALAEACRPVREP